MPEDAWNGGEIDLEKLNAHVATIGKDTDIPAAADAYAPPTIEGVSADTIKADPLFGAMAKIAHSQGIGQAKFAEAIKGYVEDAIAAEDASAKKQKELLGDKADERLQTVSNWLGASLEADEVTELRGMLTTAKGVNALEKLMNKGVSTAPRGQPPAAPTRKTKAQIDALMNTKEYYDPKHRNPAVVEEVTKWFADEAAAEEAAKK